MALFLYFNIYFCLAKVCLFPLLGLLYLRQEKILDKSFFTKIRSPSGLPLCAQLQQAEMLIQGLLPERALDYFTLIAA